MHITYKEQANKQDLSQEIEKLKAEVNLLRSENARLNTVDEENRVLRENLRFFNKKENNYILGNVISRGDVLDELGRIKSLIIDKGKADGLIKGLVVLNSQGIIVGKIFEVKENISQVFLANNPNCKFAATIFNNENTSGITEGELGLTIRMNFVPQSKEIKKEDMIVTSGLEQNIPKGLVIGKVIEVNKESNDLWQSAVIEPLVDLETLSIVSILLP